MASAALTALVQAHVPKRPYCGHVKDHTIVRPKDVALGLRYLQLNPPFHCAWLVFDIDKDKPNERQLSWPAKIVDPHHKPAFDWERANLPPPTYCAINPENEHVHLGYALAAPVCTSEFARLKPLQYLAAIEYAYMVKLKADMAYTAPTAKNPLHPSWKVWEPANAPVYELGYLAEFADLTSKRLPRVAGLGRNCDLFDGLRNWAYGGVREFWRPGGEERWQEAVRLNAESLNTFSVPLGSSELAGIARSVARYVWRRFKPASFRAVQAARGRLGGIASGAVRLEASEDKRARARVMAASGMSTRAIAEVLDIGKSSVARWVSHEAISDNSSQRVFDVNC